MTMPNPYESPSAGEQIGRTTTDLEKPRNRFCKSLIMISIGVTIANFFIPGNWDYSPSGRLHEFLSTVSFACGLGAIALMAVSVPRGRNAFVAGLVSVVVFLALLIGIFVAVSNYQLNRTTVHDQFATHAINHCIFAVNLGAGAVAYRMLQRMSIKQKRKLIDDSIPGK